MTIEEFSYYIGKLGFIRCDHSDDQEYPSFVFDVGDGEPYMTRYVVNVHEGNPYMKEKFGKQIIASFAYGAYDLKAIDADELLRIVDKMFPGLNNLYGSVRHFDSEYESKYKELRDKFPAEIRDYKINKIIGTEEDGDNG